MTYSVLLLGATGTIGSLIATELANHKSHLKRVAFLTPTANAGPDKEVKYAAVKLERVVGSLSDSASYNGFDIVISAVGDDLCPKQPEFFDAAIKAGVRHFYPTEFGADLAHPTSAPEDYFVNKIATRKYLEEKVRKDEKLGYTYILVGLFNEVFLAYNVLGLSEDRQSATFIGTPDAMVSATAAVDVARITVASLLPSHLPSLSGGREVRFSGSVIPISTLFSTVSTALGHKVDVKYLNVKESYIFQDEQKKAGNAFLGKFTSAMRAIGFGGADMGKGNNAEYPELIPVSWEEAVKGFFGK
ncbi:hypothetical protein BGZ60DRAFT_417284 [Tricladium varicosporioides]|nr:hypothetical protein BGZ60DRAFT_417284 [Hymenoscyphus varicosporioides]